MVSRYSIENGKELVLINTHNEAFDEGGNTRTAQMKNIKEFVLNEDKAGNYVIVGGDWNQYPPDLKTSFTANRAFTGKIGNFNLTGMESVSVKCIHLGFKNSDHNPVLCRVKLR